MDQSVNEQKKSTKARHPDRVTLKPEHLAKLDQWVTQVSRNHRGVRITRNNLLSWIIDELPEDLSKAQELALAKAHYDEEKFLRSTLEELKRCRQDGVAFKLPEALRVNRSKRRKGQEAKSEVDLSCE